ncbi:MAG: TonB-dependent receptor [Flammeovirgaceae bacterium]|nr:TonB-dependent receptor [Flammeovirgaceae bacterium]
MRKVLVLLLFIGVTGNALAQKFSVKGQVTDTLSSPMPSSTVMLLSAKDSVLVNFGVTDLQGNFEIKNVNAGDYLLKVTFMGFATYTKKVNASGTSSVIEVGQLQMLPKTTELDEVIVQGERAPVTVKRDTIEFNAGSFKVKPNANVEDLLKKLPGVEVETDGTVRAQGEQVQRVTVDGKEFFGRDPKLATRNLPADAVDKVQVYDRKSDQAQFTGIEDGVREKSINLELKEDKRHGAFGNVGAGVGTEDRFQFKGSLNKFAKGQQVSVLAMGNNINEQGFSISDYMNFSGGSQQMMSGGGIRIQAGGDNSSGIPLNFGGRQNGVMTNYGAGINFNKNLSKNTEINSSYFYNRLDLNLIKDLTRINYLPQGSYTYNESSQQNSVNDNHRVNLMIDHKIDSANSLRFNANVSYTDAEQQLDGQSETLTSADSVQSDNVRTTYNQGATSNLTSNLLYRHRFEKKGRSFSTNLTLGLGLTDSDGNLESTNNFYGSTPESNSLLQTNVTDNSNLSYGFTLSYTEPLGGRKYLEANYSWRTNQNDVDRQVFDEETGQPVLDTLLSSIYNSNYTLSRPGINFRMNRDKFNLTVGASYQMTNLKGNIELLNTEIDRSFENILPTAYFNYDFSTYRHLRFEYETSMGEPTIQQLQPVVDNSDPLNLYVGNPDLAPSYTHRMSLNYTTFNPTQFFSLFAFVNGNYTKNAITNSQTVNSDLVRLTIPVNVDYTYNLRANISASVPVSKWKSRFSIGPTGSVGRNINILNLEENEIQNRSLGGNLRYNFTHKEILIIDLSGNWSNQKTDYEFDTQADQVIFNQTYTSELNLNFLKNYSLNGIFEYLIYTSTTNDYYQAIPLLNLSLSRFVMKNKAGEIKLGVNNLLDQSLSVTQSSSANYLQQETTNNLGRYYMVSFTYAINKHLNPMGGMGNRRGGMRMIRQ